MCSMVIVVSGSASVASASASIPAQAPEASAIAPTPVMLEQVLVSGEQPGPGMWKVSKADHVLWIIGTQSPMPKKMIWRAKQVEAIVAQSQEIITGPSVSVSMKQIGFFKTLFLIPSAMEARKNPDGATLRSIIPADLYSRWLALRDKYIGDYQDEESDIERWRPMFAAMELYTKAINKAGLTSSNLVLVAVTDTAKKYKVKLTAVKVEPAIGDARAAINELKSSRLADTDCFAKTIERIETDLDLMRTRANAWATGDIGMIRGLPNTDQRTACEAAINSASFIKTLGVHNVRAQMEAAWLNAAESALTNNTVTLAILPIEQMLKSDGYLAKLKAKGYNVQEPDSATE